MMVEREVLVRQNLLFPVFVPKINLLLKERLQMVGEYEVLHKNNE